LKGKGWYETDFKKGNQRNLHGDKEPSAPKEKKSEDKSSSKSSAKKKSQG
jgi:hypothetical protein